jgi:tRNA A-37 threonylcarbamoyl transferase component Bud32/tetratricopeptide (TPR) repeat protein
MPDQQDRLKTALADRYAIEREIGSGGMATVYLAEDVKHHRQVAVKVLRPDLAATLGPERFLREIEIAAQLHHPHILPLYDSGEADGFLYYVMPYEEGQSLRDRLAKEGELPVAEAVKILRDVVDALTAAHEHGVVHRDIKPENILLSGRHALVTDFGVAKAVSEATGREQLTTAGVALGTPAYMAPEQAAASPYLDHRVDIYAVGAVAYELLTGRPVFMGTTPQMILSAHVTEAPQPVTKHRDTVPAVLDQLVLRCLEKKPADRFQSAEELLPLIEALATPSGGVTPTATQPVVAASVKRTRIRAVAGAVAVIALGTAAVLLWPRGGAGLDPERVAVGVLENRTGNPSLDHIGNEAADWVTRSIARAGMVNIVSATAVLQTVRDIEGREGGMDARGLAQAVARENDAGILVSGAFYSAGDSIRIEAEVTDAASGNLLSPLEPVSGMPNDPVPAFEALSQRAMGALATMLDPRLADYATATSQPPKYEAYKLFMEGLEYYLRIDYRPSIERFTRAAELDSTFMLPLLQAATAYSNLGERTQQDSLLQIVNRHRDRLTQYDAYYLDAGIAGLRGDLHARLDAWRRRAELAPGSGRDLYGAGYAANQVNRPDETLRFLLQLDPERGWVRGWTPYWTELTWAYHKLERYEDELRAARRGMVQHGGHIRVLRHQLRALVALGRIAEMEEALEGIFGVPASGGYTPAYVLFLTGLELRAHGHSDAARGVFERVVEWYESRATAERQIERNRRRLAYALAASDQWDRAHGIVDELTNEFPENVTYMGFRGVIAAQRGDSGAARRIAEELGALDRPYLNGQNTYWRAVIAAALGESDQAVQLLRDAFLEGVTIHDNVHREPAFESLRDYPAFQEFMRPKG